MGRRRLDRQFCYGDFYPLILFASVVPYSTAEFVHRLLLHMHAKSLEMEQCPGFTPGFTEFVRHEHMSYCKVHIKI